MLLLFYGLLGFFGHEACGILAPQPGIRPTAPAFEGKVLTIGPPGKSHEGFCFFFFSHTHPELYWVLVSMISKTYFLSMVTRNISFKELKLFL